MCSIDVLMQNCSSHAVGTVCPQAVFGIDLARDDPDVQVVPGALAPAWALAQGAGVDQLLLDWVVSVLPDAEQSARLLALTPQLLQKQNKERQNCSRPSLLYYHTRNPGRRRHGMAVL